LVPKRFKYISPSLSFHRKGLTNSKQKCLFKASQTFKKIFPILSVVEYLCSINAAVGAQRKSRFIGTHNMMYGTGCLPASGYAFRRGGRASSLGCLGIQKAYLLYTVLSSRFGTNVIYQDIKWLHP